MMDSLIGQSRRTAAGSMALAERPFDVIQSVLSFAAARTGTTTERPAARTAATRLAAKGHRP
jgi:hypothetical protein